MTFATIVSELRALFEQSKQGDQQAYTQLLHRIAVLMRAYLRRRLTRQEADVEDLDQEVLLAGHTKRHTYDDSPVSYTTLTLPKTCLGKDAGVAQAVV